MKILSCIFLFLFVNTCAQEKRDLTLDKLTFTEKESIIRDKKVIYEFNSKYNKSRDAILYKNYNTVKTYLITDGNLLNYDGVKGKKLLLTTYDGIIGEYIFTVGGKENIEKIIDILLKKYPDLRSYPNSSPVRFKTKINDSTYLQIWIHDEIPNVISLELEYSTKYKNGSSILSFNYDDEVNSRKKYEEKVRIEYYPNKEKKYKIVLEPK